LTAIGLSELIVETEAQFERLAMELATDPDRLVAVTAELAQNRLTQPLFDTLSYVRHLERASAMMMGRRRDGLEPDHIEIVR
jgi:protein O-GlcNAc transferase